MNIIQLTAQLFGISGTLLSLILYHQKNMKKVLRVKILIDIVWGIHYLLLSAFAGFFTNLICIFRELTFMNNDKKIFQSKLWLIFFILLNWIAAILTSKNIYNFFPALVSTLATISFWQKSIRKARYIAITNNIIMFTYDAFVSSIAGMICESLSFISVLSAIITDFNNKRKENRK